MTTSENGQVSTSTNHKWQQKPAEMEIDCAIMKMQNRFGNMELSVAPTVSCRLWDFVSSDESHFFFHSLTSADFRRWGWQASAITFLDVGYVLVCQLANVIG